MGNAKDAVAAVHKGTPDQARSASPKAKKLVQVLEPTEKHWVGDGFYVSTLFSVHQDDLYPLLTPFILLDYASPRVFPKEPQKQRGVGSHPHRGFETVTFAMRGEIDHRDSAGGGGTIGEGDIQWMTAGSGLVHEEFHSEQFRKNGGVLEMLQLWVNLPARLKMTTPRYQAIRSNQFPMVKSGSNGAVNVKVIAGDFIPNHHSQDTQGEKVLGPAKTHTPIRIYDAHFQGTEPEGLSVQVPEGHSLLVMQVEETSTVGEQELRTGSLAVFDRQGSTIELTGERGARLIILSGEPIDEPAVAYGPFVMNSGDEIRQAIMDFNAGKMGKIRPEGEG